MKRELTKNIQYPKITCSDTEGEIQSRISVPFRHLNHSFSVSLSKSVYEGAKTSGKSAIVPSGCGDAWLFGYYTAFVLDPALAIIYKSVLAKFRQLRRELSLSSDEYLELLTAYVQSLPYDTKKLEDPKRVPRFPIETIVDGTGICSDKSILLAGLLSHEGYAVSLLQFGPENHVTVGIPVPNGYDYLKTGHAVIESTVISYIGDVSGEFAPGRKIFSKPKIFPIGHGSKRYESIAEVKHITETLAKLMERIDPDGEFAEGISSLMKKISNEKLRLGKKLEELKSEELIIKNLQEKNDPNFLEKYHAYKTAVASYNEEVTLMTKHISRYNLMVEEYNRFASDAHFLRANRLDRRAAFQRIKNLNF